MAWRGFGWRSAFATAIVGWASLVGPARAADAPGRVEVRGRKIAARPVSRSEAGVSWSLGPRLALEFDYARNAFPPLMPNDHDDGLIGRLKLGF